MPLKLLKNTTLEDSHKIHAPYECLSNSSKNDTRRITQNSHSLWALFVFSKFLLNNDVVVPHSINEYLPISR
jgi:hypothetical protein